ncbi:MAG: hypothetical protein UD961_00430 [Bacteroidales bacterium]|nr:hypothetical protein [Bacteroidales bacterium]
MKRILMMMSLALSLAVMAGCDPADPTPTPKPEPEPDPTPAIQSFEVAVDTVTKTSVTYTVTPALLDKEYLAVVKTADSIEGLEDEDIVNLVFADIKAAAGAEGLTFAEKMPKVAVKGTQDRVELTGLAVDTEYALVVFGVDPAKDWEFTTFPVVKEFKTEAMEIVEYTFDVTTTVENNTVSFKVVPSDNNIAWHLLTVTKAMYDAYTDPAGDYQWTKDVFYQAYTENEIQTYAGMGYTEEQILSAMFLKGEQTLQAEGLNANTEYVYLIAAFVVEGNNLLISSEASEGTYTTGDVAKSELTFDISVTDVEQMRAAIKITPSDLEAAFVWMCQAYDGVSTPAEVMDAIVAANKSWLDMGFMSYYGVQDFTGGPGSQYKYKLDSPDTDYCVIAFGYAGGVTSEPEMVTFRTLPGADPAECTFDLVLNETTTYGFSFNVTPSDATTYYYGDVCVASEYDEASIVAEVEAGIQQMYEMNKMFSPDLTMSAMIAQYYWNGPNVMDADNLTPDTEYTVYILALDSKTGKVVKAHKYPSFAKTKPVGTIVPEIELIGYYSGDEEAGAIFGQPAATAGKAIAVVKYNVDPAATALYSGVLEGNGMDAVEYDDVYINEMLKFYWDGVSLQQPYSFFVTTWQMEQTVFAYAEDANGGKGALGRFLLCPTAEEKGNIEDLKALVAELNGQSKAASAPASVNTREVVTGKPVVTVREKAETVSVEPSPMVARPVEQMALRTGNLIQLNYIPSFWVK